MDAPVTPRALITGGSAGIGLEMAKLLAARGYDLILTGASERVQTATSTLRDTGVNVIAVQSDLSAPSGVEAVVQAEELQQL